MDIEQLKLILETIKTISGDASSVAIWYFALHYGITFLSHVLVGTALLGVVYMVATAVKSSYADEALVKDLRAEFCEYASGWVSDSERAIIRKKLAEWKIKANGNT